MAQSLLSYGSGLLSGDLGQDLELPLGLSGPIAGWNHVVVPAVGEEVAGAGGGGGAGLVSGASGGGHLNHFISLVTQDDVSEKDKQQQQQHDGGGKKAARQLLGVDSPSGSPGSASVHLPQTVLQIMATSLGADAVVMAVLHEAVGGRETGGGEGGGEGRREEQTYEMVVDGRDREAAVEAAGWRGAAGGKVRMAETIICTPKGMFPETVAFSEEMVAGISGKVLPTAALCLDPCIQQCLEKQPTAFIASHVKLKGFDGVLYAFWCSSDRIQPSVESVMSRAVRTMPLLLANRISARKSERLGRQFDAILKRMPQAVVFVDDELAQVVVNPSAADLLELPCFGEVDPVKVASSMRQLAERSGSRPDLQRWFSMVAGTADTVIQEEWEYGNPRKVLRVESYPVSSNTTSAHGRLWLFEDLTAERNARDAIRQANRAKSQFLAMMSHELRTPMTGVLGMLDLLKLTQVEREQADLLKVMQSSADGLMTVLNNILDFSKMEAGRLMLEEIDFNAADILDQVRAMFEQQASDKGLHLAFCFEPREKMVVRGDPVRLKQVVANLVSNAVKFSDKGSVRLTWDAVAAPTTSLAADMAMSQHEGKLVEEMGSSWGRSVRPAWNEAVRLSRLKSGSVKNSPGSFMGLAPEAERAAAAAAAAGGGVDGFEAERMGRVEESRQGLMSAAGGVQLAAQQQQSLNAEVEGSHSLMRNNSREGGGQGTFEREAVGRGGVCPSCGKEQGPGEREGQGRREAGVRAGGVRETGLCESCFKWRSRHSRVEKDEEMAEVARERGEQEEGGEKTVGGGPMEVEDQQQQKGGEAAAVGDQRLWFHVCIKDTGRGMNAKQMRMVMESSQAAASTRDPGSTGLGLAICKGLLELMGGQMWIDSQLEIGTTVHLLLPFSRAEHPESVLPCPLGQRASAAASDPAASSGFSGQATSGAATPPASSVQSKESCGIAAAEVAAAATAADVESGVPMHLKVLVAEDNKVNQLLIRKLLKHYGHEVVLVGNGKLALEAVQEDEYDMVLMDLQMPILDGLSATREIRKLQSKQASIPIYALTADVFAPEIEEAGMSGFLSKPIAWDKMSLVVDKILAAKKKDVIKR